MLTSLALARRSSLVFFHFPSHLRLIYAVPGDVALVHACWHYPNVRSRTPISGISACIHLHHSHSVNVCGTNELPYPYVNLSLLALKAPCTKQTVYSKHLLHLSTFFLPWPWRERDPQLGPQSLEYLLAVTYIIDTLYFFLASINSHTRMSTWPSSL